LKALTEKILRRHDIEHNGSHHNVIQHIGLNSDLQHNATRQSIVCYNTECQNVDTMNAITLSGNTLRGITLTVAMLNVGRPNAVTAECRGAISKYLLNRNFVLKLF